MLLCWFGRCCTRVVLLCAGVKWSPDGACLLTANDDNWYGITAATAVLVVVQSTACKTECFVTCSLRIFDLPTYSVHGNQESSCLPPDQGQDSFPAALQIQEGELVYDYAWYSCMHTSDPASCCFATTSRVCPTALTVLMPQPVVLHAISLPKFASFACTCGKHGSLRHSSQAISSAEKPCDQGLATPFAQHTSNPTCHNCYFPHRCDTCICGLPLCLHCSFHYLYKLPPPGMRNIFSTLSAMIVIS